MSWLVTFAILSLIILGGFLFCAFFQGIFEWDECSEKSWKAYFSLSVVIAMLIGIVYLIHYGVVTRHLFGV